jgi:RNA polymerase sigma factor (sigma-70 family)
LEQWFADEILPHEAALMRYLAKVWPVRSELVDLRQDVYVRVFESARDVRPTAPKAFLFATARNLVIDRVRHSRVISIDSTQDFANLNVLIDEISPEHRVNARQELRRLSEAFDQLSDKCRAVIWLRRVEGLSQRDAAERLGMQEGAVESQLARGVRLLAQSLIGRMGMADAQKSLRDPDDEAEHG